MKKHYFDIDVAQMVGVNAAVLLENIAHWCEHNQANRTNFHDGRYWTYNSIKAFNELFPYLSTSAIRTALDKLKETGLIVVGNYNKSAYDRTMWYALTEKAEAFLSSSNSICEKSKMHFNESSNQNDGNSEPIPDVTTDVTTDVTSSVTNTPIAPKGQETEQPTFGANEDNTEDNPVESTPIDQPASFKPYDDGEYTPDFEMFWAMYPLHQDKRQAFKAYRRARRRASAMVIAAGAQKYASDPNLPEPRYIKHAATWLNADGWANDPLPSRTSHPSKTQTRFNDNMNVVKQFYEQDYGHPMPENGILEVES